MAAEASALTVIATVLVLIVAAITIEKKNKSQRRRTFD
jgi:energy-converting hydrogenase Eha subunit C